MKLGTKIALGVDISENLISMALLKREGSSVKLLKTISGPVGEGVIKNGSIEDISALAKAVRKLKNRLTIRSINVAVSLFTKPVIVQIMDIPKEVPNNIRQFVKSQVKHWAVLPGREIALDFCGVSGVGPEISPASRLLAVAADGQRVAEIVKVCSKAGLVVEAIEPPLLAYTRVFYAKKIAGKFDCNVLIGILRRNTLTLCVFRRQNLDFVRTNDISEDKKKPDELCRWLTEQINTVIQFYDVEVPDGCGKWEITVVADSVQLPENTEDTLRAKVEGANLQIVTGEGICQAAGVSQSGRYANRPGADGSATGKPSPVAIGLAMKLLDTNAHNLGVNLLPPEITSIRAAQKGALITVNAIAAMLLIMILAISVPAWKVNRLNERINRKKASLLYNTQALVDERILVDEKINTISNKLNQINQILNSRHDVNWARLLNDIGKGTPKTVCITKLLSKGGNGMSLEGLALSNEDVYLFVDMLNKSEHINSASIVETEKGRGNSGLVSYEIRCSLNTGKGI